MPKVIDWLCLRCKKKFTTELRIFGAMRIAANGICPECRRRMKRSRYMHSLFK